MQGLSKISFTLLEGSEAYFVMTSPVKTREIVRGLNRASVPAEIRPTCEQRQSIKP